MFDIYALNYIWSGIPELIVYESKQAFDLAWKEAWQEAGGCEDTLFCTTKCLEKCEKIEDQHLTDRLDGSLKHSTDAGYMEGHKQEFRAERLFQSGVHLSSLEAAKMLVYGVEDGGCRYSSRIRDKIGEMILKDYPNLANIWPRKCSHCNKGMLKGWVWGEGEGYACSEHCLYTFNDGMWTPEEIDNDYKANLIYYTEWLWDDDLDLNELIEMIEQQHSDTMIQLDGENDE